ncbi:hypothetical protein CHU94_18360 [Rhodoferax sp. TH121]|nr:hypothetical protein CHU94_18360 [Rhodoferax sp. TH121]
MLHPVPSYFSIYMDGLRLAAAYYVFLFHLKKLQIGTESFLKLIPDHGHDAVVLFFVLSGYVIAATVDRKKSSGWQDYLLDRAARVYSVALPTLIFSALVALVIQWAAQGGSRGLSVLGVLGSTVLNFFFLGQSWGLESWVVYNQPYWSLCYEVLYYALFGVAVFAKSYWRYIGLLIVGLMTGPKVLLLLPCWLLGVYAYRWRDRLVMSPTVAVVVGFVLPVAILVLLNKLGFGPSTRAWMDALIENRKDRLEFSADFLIDYVTATLVAINLYAARFIPFRFPNIVSAVFKGGANISFTLYLMHMPLIYLVLHFVADARHTLFWFFVCAIGVPLFCYFVSQFTELRRSSLRHWLALRLAVFNRR